MSAIVTSHFKNLASDSFFEHLTDADQKYYLFIGRVTPWDEVYENINGVDVLVSGETRPPYMTNSYFDQIEAWKRMTAAKKLSSSDVSYCIRKIDWKFGEVYNEFRDDVANMGNYYVLTDERHIFKCLHTPKDDDGNLLTSTSKPQKIMEFSTRVAADGYVWKYMMTVPQIDIDKFQTSSFIPIRKVAPDTPSMDDETQQIAVKNLLEDNNVIREGRVNNVIVNSSPTNYLSFLYTTTAGTEISNGASSANFITAESTDLDSLHNFLQNTPISEGGADSGRTYDYRDIESETDFYVHNLSWIDLNNDVFYNLHVHYFDQVNNEIINYPVEFIKIQKTGVNREVVFELPIGTQVDRNIPSGSTVYVGPKVSIKNVSEDSKYFFAVPTTYGMERESKFFGYGKINSFRVIYDGAGYYTKADQNNESILTIDYPLTGVVVPDAEIMVSPYKGHGYNALDELNANYIMITQAFEYDENDTIDVSNDFRQIGLWRQPENFDDQAGTITTARQSSKVTLSAPLPSPLQIDAVVYVKDDQNEVIAWGTVVKKDVTYKHLYLTNVQNSSALQSAVSNGSVLYYRNAGSSDEFEVGQLAFYGEPDLKERTGELLYIENRKPVSRAIDQIESIKIIVEF